MCPRCQGHYCSGQQRSNDGPDSDVITSMAPFIERCLSLISSRNFPEPEVIIVVSLPTKPQGVMSRMRTMSPRVRVHVWRDAMPCLMQSVAGLWPRSVGFCLSLGLLVDKVAMGQHLLPILLLTSVSIIQPLLKTHFCICQRRCTILAIQNVVTLSTLRLTWANYWHIRALSTFSSSPTPTADTWRADGPSFATLQEPQVSSTRSETRCFRAAWTLTGAPPCSGAWPFEITYLNTIVSTLRDWYRRIRTRTRV